MFDAPVRAKVAAAPTVLPLPTSAAPMTTNRSWARLVQGYLAFGPDLVKLARWSHIDKDKVKEYIEDEDFLDYVNRCKLNPTSIQPHRSEIICMLYVEAREAESSRDRQSAMRSLLELSEPSQ